MTEPRRRLRTQFIDQRGWLVRVYETPEAATNRGLGGPYAEYGSYSEEFPPDEAREILQREVDALARRLREFWYSR